MAIKKSEKRAAAQVGGSLLGALAKQATTKKGTASKNPRRRLPALEETVDRIAINIVKAKALAGAIEEDKPTMLEAFFQQRNEASRAQGKYFTTVTFEGKRAAIKVTQKYAYSDLDYEAREKAIAALQVALGCTDTKAIAAFEERFIMKMDIGFDKSKLDDEALSKIEALIAAQPWLADFLVVKQVWEPTRAFHEAAACGEDEGKLYQALLDNRAMKPHTPSFAVG